MLAVLERRELRLREAEQLRTWKGGGARAHPGLTLHAHSQPSTSWGFVWKAGFAKGERKCDLDP